MHTAADKPLAPGCMQPIVLYHGTRLDRITEGAVGKPLAPGSLRPIVPQIDTRHIDAVHTAADNLLAPGIVQPITSCRVLWLADCDWALGHFACAEGRREVANLLTIY